MWPEFPSVIGPRVLPVWASLPLRNEVSVTSCPGKLCVCLYWTLEVSSSGLTYKCFTCKHAHILGDWVTLLVGDNLTAMRGNIERRSLQKSLCFQCSWQLNWPPHSVFLKVDIGLALTYLNGVFVVFVCQMKVQNWCFSVLLFIYNSPNADWVINRNWVRGWEPDR